MEEEAEEEKRGQTMGRRALGLKEAMGIKVPLIPDVLSAFFMLLAR
jgi:hypothetical protein